jgi:hypothetical protein
VLDFDDIVVVEQAVEGAVEGVEGVEGGQRVGGRGLGDGAEEDGDVVVGVGDAILELGARGEVRGNHAVEELLQLGFEADDVAVEKVLSSVFELALVAAGQEDAFAEDNAKG